MNKKKTTWEKILGTHLHDCKPIPGEFDFILYGKEFWSISGQRIPMEKILNA